MPLFASRPFNRLKNTQAFGYEDLSFLEIRQKRFVQLVAKENHAGLSSLLKVYRRQLVGISARFHHPPPRA